MEFIQTNTGNDLVLGTGGVQKVRITSNGIVGIGTDIPGSRNLQVYDSTGTAFISLKTGTGTLTEYLFGNQADDNVGRIRYDHSDNSMALWTNADERLRITSDGKVRVPDGGKFTCGASDDLEIYHNGSASVINDKGTGDFYIQGSSNIYIRDYDTSENHIIMTKNGSVQLYHDSSKKLETASTGILVTGQVNASTMHLTDGTGYSYWQ